MDYINPILEYLYSSLKLTLLQTFILIGPGLILAFFMNFIAGMVEKRAYNLLGRGIYLGLFGWLGTSVHELGHAIMCILFLHKITDIKLFNPDPDSGTLGYVSHSYNPENSYHLIGNFFIGIGPVIIGTIVIYFSAYYLISKSFFIPFKALEINHTSFISIKALEILIYNIHESFSLFAINTFTLENLKRWEFYLFFYILFCVGSSITLSSSDIKNALSGFIVFIVSLFIINIFASFMSKGISTNYLVSLTRHYTPFYIMMIFALLINIVIYIPLFIIERVFGRGNE